MQVIRNATPADIPRLVELGSRSLREGSYHGKYGDNPEVTTKLAERALQSPHARVIVADVDGVVVGLFFFVVYPHMYTGQLVAGEMMWYVEPEHRAGATGLKLRWRAEELARELGATEMQITAPNDEIAAMFAKMHGYEKMETGFRRGLLCHS
jgi:acetyltransferase (GNAT) family protein